MALYILTTHLHRLEANSDIKNIQVILPFIENLLIALHVKLNGNDPNKIDIHRSKALSHVYDMFAIVHPLTTLSTYIDLLKVTLLLLMVTLDTVQWEQVYVHGSFNVHAYNCYVLQMH